MASLVDKVPEARFFCQYVIDNWEKYRVFPNETFAELHPGVFTTTSVDSQGESMSLGVLHSFERALNHEPIWGHAHHNPLIQPPGRILCAKVFFEPESGVYFLAGAFGAYDPKSFPSFADVGIDVASLERGELPEPSFHSWSPQAHLALNPHELDVEDFKQALATAPEVVRRDIEEHSRKGANLPAIVTIAATFWLLAANPFSKKFLERYGEAAADASLGFLKWLRDEVFTRVAKVVREPVIVQFQVSDSECAIQFVIASKDPTVLANAAQQLREGGASLALGLLQALQHLEPVRLVFEFDPKAQKWLPLHAATRKAGVIADRPVLIALQELQGFSVGGSLGFMSKRDRNGT